MTQENLRVLLVDDEWSLRKPLAEYLTINFGFKVDDAANGEEALQLVEENRGLYDVALIDYLLLTEPDGVEVMRRIKASYPEIECIIFTGWGTKERQRALQEGAFRYLEKPFDSEELALLVRTAAQQVRLRAISRAILSKRNLDQVLDQILSATSSLTQADEAIIVLLDEASSTLKRYKTTDIASSEHQENDEDFPNQALFQEIVDAGRAISVGEIPKNDPISIPAYRMGYRSFVGVPIPGEHDHLGVLYACSRMPGHFGAGETVALLQTLAGQASLAIVNARAFQRIQTQATDLETLQRLSVDVASSLDLNEVMTRTCQAAVEFFQADHSGLVLFDDNLAQGFVAAEYPPEVGAFGQRIPLQGVRDEERLVSQIKPVLIEDIAEKKDLGPVRDILHGRYGIQSILIVPIVSKGKLLGSFGLDAIDCRRLFTQKEVELCEMFAAQVAVAIDNAILYEETRRREQLLAALEDASRHIRGEKEPERLEQEIVRLAAELMGCDAACLFFNHPYRNELELTVVHKLPKDLKGTRVSDTEGLIGVALRSGSLCVQSGYDVWPDKDIVFAECGFKAAAAIPLRQEESVAGILFLADTQNPGKFSHEDQEILGSFAIQASIALQTSRAMTREQRSISTLAVIREASDYIQAADSLEKILHVVLIGVTAGYGLEFNRSALLLLDDTRTILSGRIGIGQFTEEEAMNAWADDRNRGLDNFDRYLNLLEVGDIKPTPVDAIIRCLELPVHVDGLDAFSRAVRDQRFALITDQEQNFLPQAFVDAFAPAFPLVIAPLVARDRTIGILVADNKFTRSPITPELISTLGTFVNTAAIAIYNAQLYQQTRSSQEQLRSYYEASNTIVASTDLDQVLEDIVERARQTARAHSVGMVLLNEAGQVRKIIVAGAKQPTDVSEMVRPNGLTVQVMQSGRPIVIDDTADEPEKINPSGFWRDIRAAMCLPVILEGRSLGVMWFYYPASRTFSQHEIDAAQLYVNQAAVAYDSARRVEELEQMRRAAEALAKATEPHQALQQIVESAAIVLHADSVAVWSYDDVRDKFIPEELTAYGIADTELAKLRETEPKPGQTAYTVMDRGYVSIVNVAEPEDDFIGKPTRELLERIGARSFQAITLRVGEECLGILYANYLQQRAFGEEEETTLRTFASHAAMALKTARLMTQLERTKKAAGVVAGAVVQQDLHLTLDEIAQNTREVLDADVVNLYAYDEATDKFAELGSSILDQIKPHSVPTAGQLTESSAAYRILDIKDPPYYRLVDDYAIDDPVLGGSFVQEEQVRAAIGVQLRVRQHKVGVMFVNFRAAHRFTDDEISTVRLFADQAAAAIRNTQLYRQTARLLEQARLVTEISREAASNLEIEPFLESLFTRLVAIFLARQIPVFPSLATYDEADESLNTHHTRFHSTNKRPSRIQKDAGGIMAWVARESKPYYAPDVSVDQNYYPLLEATRSEIAVPVFYGDDLVAVLDLESPVPDAFTLEDRVFLQTLANQIAVTVHNVQQYSDLRRTKGMVGARTAVAWMRMVSAQWHHQVRNDAITIRDNLSALRSSQTLSIEEIERAQQRVDRALTRIIETPMTAPLQREEQVESVAIGKLMKERFDQLSKRERYRSVPMTLECSVDDSITVRVSPQWLARVLELLVDNAVTAMNSTPKKHLIVVVNRKGDRVEVAVRDTGPGIPQNILPTLLKEPIKKDKGSVGMGMGLLLAQTIVQTYGGDIYVSSTHPTGTTMVFWLPIEI